MPHPTRYAQETEGHIGEFGAGGVAFVRFRRPRSVLPRPILISRLSRSMMSQGHVSCTLQDAIGTVLLRMCRRAPGVLGALCAFQAM
jgi:hypothetical protein